MHVYSRSYQCPLIGTAQQQLAKQMAPILDSRLVLHFQVEVEEL